MVKVSRDVSHLRVYYSRFQSFLQYMHVFETFIEARV